jgi:DNA-binding NarL/FixJ family response regulator
MSPHCQSLGRSKVKNYGLAENITDSFTSEAAATDSRYPVDRTVQFKMDFIEGWLQEQTKRDRAIIVDLAMGESTGDVARKYGVSDGLISQYRKRFRASWNEYISDKKDDALKAA